MDLFEMIASPFANFQKLYGLNQAPDRHLVKTRRTSNEEPDLLRRNRLDGIYKAFGVYSHIETRYELYAIYREMATDPVIISTLDEYAANAAQKDVDHNCVIWVESPNAQIQQICSDTLKRLRINEWAFPIQHALARDGDVFMGVYGKRNYGVVAIRPYEPWTIARVEDNIGRLTAFAHANEMGQPTDLEATSVPNYRALHFRLPPRELTDIYGAKSSYLYGSRVIWRMLQLMEDQVVIQRLLRRPDRLMILADTAGMSHDEAWNAIKDLERRFKKELYADPNNNFFSSSQALPDLAKDVILPRGEGNNTEIENFPATNTNDLLRDLGMFYGRLAAGLGVPAKFFGQSESGYNPGQSLARQYEPFARRAERLQNAFLPEIARLLMIDLIYKNMNPLHPQNAFTLNMTTISPIQEIERAEVIALKQDRLLRALTLGKQFGFDLKVWIPMALARYGGFTHQLIDAIYPTSSPEPRTDAQVKKILTEFEDAVVEIETLPKTQGPAQVTSGQVSDVLSPAWGDLKLEEAKSLITVEGTAVEINESDNIFGNKEQMSIVSDAMKSKRADAAQSRLNVIYGLAGAIQDGRF